jgi:MFS transporter, ACDE family, multidrug resistance protein
LQGLVFVASLFGLGALAEIFGYYKFYLLGLSLISIALLLIALSTEALLLWPSSVALGLGLGILHIANFMSFAKVGEQTSMNQISPLLAMVGPAGGLLGGLLGAAFGHYIGLQAIFLPISLAFMFFTFLILRSKKFQQFLEHDSSYISLQRQEP